MKMNIWYHDMKKSYFFIFICIAFMSILICISAAASDIHIEIWNTGSVPAGRGHIAYEFTLYARSLSYEITDIIINTNLGDLEVNSIGRSNFNRYATTKIESQQVIKSIRITGVTGKIDGKLINLKKYFAVRKFVPVRITIK